MRPRHLPTPVSASLSDEDRRAIVNGIAIGAGVAVLTEVAKFALQEARDWLARRRESREGDAP